MATTIRYPSALTLGLSKGIPLALESGLDAYERARDRERRDLLTNLEMARLQMAIQEQQARQGARASLPTTLQTLAGLAQPGPAPSQPFTMPVPEMAPGVDTPLPPAGTPGILAGVEAPGLSMTLPGATPQAPRTTAELLQKPGAAEAVSQGLLAGIHPIGAGGVFDVEGHAKQIKAEEDKAKAAKELREGMNEFIDATDWKGQVRGMAKWYEAGIPLGKWPDHGPFLRFIKDEQEVEAMKEGFGELQPILRRVRDHADTPEDMDTLVRLSMTSRSETIRARTKALVDTAEKAHGPGVQAIRRFYEIRQQDPMLTALDAWQRVHQELPNQAAAAEEGGKFVPLELRAYMREEEIDVRERTKADYRPEPKPPTEPVSLTPEKRSLDIVETARRLATAGLDPITRIQMGMDSEEGITKRAWPHAQRLADAETNEETRRRVYAAFGQPYTAREGAAAPARPGRAPAPRGPAPAGRPTPGGIPPAAQYPGRIAKDPATGKRYRSNGQTWEAID